MKKFVREGIEIGNMDCVEYMKTMDDETVQCVVTSPPYWGLNYHPSILINCQQEDEQNNGKRGDFGMNDEVLTITGYFRGGMAFFHENVAAMKDCHFSLHVEEKDKLQMHKFNMVMASQMFVKACESINTLPDWDLFDHYRRTLALSESVKLANVFTYRSKGEKLQKEEPKTWSPYACAYAEMKRLCSNLKRLYFFQRRDEWMTLEKYQLRDLILRLTQNNTCAISGLPFYSTKRRKDGTLDLLKTRNEKIDHRHALVRNTQIDLKLYPHVSDSLINLFAVWHDEHLSKQSWGRVKHIRSLERLEQHLASHPKLSSALNCEDNELTLNWELVSALSEFKQKILRAQQFDTSIATIMELTDMIFLGEGKQSV